MKRKTMVLIALAVVCGLGASYMTSRLLSDRQQQEETIKVLVVKNNLDTGIIIKKPEEMFEEKEFSRDTAPKDVLTKFEEVKGRQLKIPRRKGDTISMNDLYDDKGPGMMNNLPLGHRAVGIRVSSEQIAAGFAAVPFSRVDIACRVPCLNNTDKECGTRIILQNVLVLASGQATVRDEGGKAMLSDVVTVALVPDDALKLETAKAKGSVTMFLRPFGELGVVKTRLMTWENVIESTKNDGKDDSDEGKKSTGPPDSIVVPSTNSAPLAQTPTNEKHVTRVTNGPTAVRMTFSKDADGNYYSHSEDVVPNSPSPSVAPGTGSISRQPSNSAAPTAPAQKQ